MLGIQEAVVASGIPEDAKEELKVSLVLERHLNLLPFIIIKFIFYNHKCALSIGPSSVFKIVKMIMERNFQPVIIFSFSKKECEAYALQVSKLDFNTGMCNRAVHFRTGTDTCYW